MARGRYRMLFTNINQPIRPGLRTFTVPLLLVLLLFLAAPNVSLARGLPIESRISSEQAILISSSGRQQIITSIDLEQAGPNAAVIFPVPAAPQVDQLAGGDQLFGYLNEATSPRIEKKNRYVLGRPELKPVEDPGLEDAVLLGREMIGGYDVARLAATDAGALQTWLDTNGYKLPADAWDILDVYAAEGWSFVAVRMIESAPTGSLAPLRISYEGDRMIYPMRLGALSDRPVALDLYVLADSRTTIAGMETLYAGPTAQLDPGTDPRLSSIISEAPYLTRLHSTELAPASLTADFTIERADSDEPFRKVETVYTDVSLFGRVGLLIVLGCTPVLSMAAFAIALGFKRRIDAVSPSK